MKRKRSISLPQRKRRKKHAGYASPDRAFEDEEMTVEEAAKHSEETVANELEAVDDVC